MVSGEMKSEFSGSNKKCNLIMFARDYRGILIR
jgi:hypothetical protein